MGRDVIAVVGPTCTGKGALALALAEALGGPGAAALIVCDSVKVYRGADVGTAKVVGAARAGFTFHMVDVAAPGEVFSAGRYMTEGRAACEEIWREDKVAVVVGGSGLYFRALVDGICAAPPADAEVRRRLRERQAAGEDLHKYLTEVDAAAAARIAPADTKRVVRALEVFELSGLPLTSFHRRKGTPLRLGRTLIVAVDGPRPWLAARIDRRTRRILAAGLRPEVERLLAQVPGPTAPPLNAIGYRHMVAVFEGRLREEELAPLITRDTRRLAKRQRTWFRGERRAVRLDGTRGTAALCEEVRGLWRRLKT